MASYFLKDTQRHPLLQAMASCRFLGVYDPLLSSTPSQYRTTLDRTEAERFGRAGLGVSEPEQALLQLFAPTGAGSGDECLAELRRLGLTVEPAVHPHPLQRTTYEDEIQSTPSWASHLRSEDTEFSIKYLVRSAARAGKRQRTAGRTDRLKRAGEVQVARTLKRLRHEHAQSERRTMTDRRAALTHRRLPTVKESDI
jgi:hypothetical protein